MGQQVPSFSPNHDLLLLELFFFKKKSALVKQVKYAMSDR